MSGRQLHDAVVSFPRRGWPDRDLEPAGDELRSSTALSVAELFGIPDDWPEAGPSK